MSDHAFIRVELGLEHDRTKLADLFRKSLQRNGLWSEDLLYHAFDGRNDLDLVQSIGCDAKDPQAYSCGTVDGLKPKSKLYNPLDTALILEKPGLLVYKRRSLVSIDETASLYRFKGKNYFRGLVGILLAKRPRIDSRSELVLDI
jgi:hypothetical protein